MIFGRDSLGPGVFRVSQHVRNVNDPAFEQSAPVDCPASGLTGDAPIYSRNSGE
jgi:hypothetical protein